MLVLTRKKDDAIVIGTPPNQIFVTVVDIRNDKVRIGVQCAIEIPVHRQEVFEAIQHEHQEKLEKE